MAAPVCVLTIVKDFTYRGQAGEEWSNTYNLSGTTPANSTAWRAVFDNWVNMEKQLYSSAVRVIKGYGYSRIPQTGDAAVWTVDLRPSATTVAGTMASTGGAAMAGDQAGWIRWSLNRFSTTGKRVYLRKYYHGAYVNSSSPDQMSAAWKTLAQTIGDNLFSTGMLDSRQLVDKDGNVPIAAHPADYVTTRTLKRRGKRP